MLEISIYPIPVTGFPQMGKTLSPMGGRVSPKWGKPSGEAVRFIRFIPRQTKGEGAPESGGIRAQKPAGPKCGLDK